MAKRRPRSKTGSRSSASTRKTRSAQKSSRRSSSKDNGSLFDAVDDALLIGIPLRQAAQERYLNYSLSVITSRALPDVRDGLKPVQRRILYMMSQQGLSANAKHRKCAKVVGDVMGNYHPHGDSSIYDALVRMAQPFSLRMPLVDGSGNFGSIDGDNAAAMRYTECRLTPVASELLTDLATRTVAFKPNYDGTREEPVVLAQPHAQLAGQRRDRNRRRHGDEYSPAQLERSLSGAAETVERSGDQRLSTGCQRRCSRARLSHRRPDHQHERRAARDLSNRARDDQAARDDQDNESRRGTVSCRSHRFPTASTNRYFANGSAKSFLPASCRWYKKSAIFRPTRFVSICC